MGIATPSCPVWASLRRCQYGLQEPGHLRRFGLRPSSVATGPRRSASSDGEAVLTDGEAVSRGRETAGCFICMQLTPQPSLTNRILG